MQERFSGGVRSNLPYARDVRSIRLRGRDVRIHPHGVRIHPHNHRSRLRNRHRSCG